MKEVIIEQLVVKPDEVKPETSLINDLGVDSLDTVDLVLALEEKYGMEIPDEDAVKMDTVEDVVRYVEKKIKG